jgi:hypothetical protein
MANSKTTKADKLATATLISWTKSVKLHGERSMVRDVDTRLVAIEYPAELKMGTKVVTLREGTLVAWFDSRDAARAAITKAMAA